MARWTIINEDQNSILISKSLLDKVAQQQQKKSTNDASNSIAQHATSEIKFPEYLGSIQNDQPYSQQQQFPMSQISPPQSFVDGGMLLELRCDYERKLQQFQSVWRESWEQLDKLNQKMLKSNADKLQQETQRLDAVLLKRHHLDPATESGIRSAPCQQYEDKVLRCYQLNPKKPLLCAEWVKNLSDCIDVNRLNSLKQK